MEMITFEEEECYVRQGYDTSETVGIHGRGRLVFEVRYFITKEAIDTGHEHELRKRNQLRCKNAILEMLKDAIVKFEGG